MLRHQKRVHLEVSGLAMPDQDLTKPFHDKAAPGLLPDTHSFKPRLILAVLPLSFAGVIATLLTMLFLREGQWSVSETILIVSMTVLAGWDALPTATAMLGLLRQEEAITAQSNAPFSIAILLTLRDEDAHQVLPHNITLLKSLHQRGQQFYSLHVLSDSADPRHVATERRMLGEAALKWPHLTMVHHHRAQNIDYKAGNIRSWIRTHGDAFEACLVLDADSLIDAQSVLKLASTLAHDHTCALVQSVPRVLPQGTLWQVLQGKASLYYGVLQGAGAARWMGREANYFGHNAMFRTRAFAEAAGLPSLHHRFPWGGSILSHDFVEAALLRRAGWAVRLLPEIGGSFEQAPPDMISHLRRDQRWCHGNFQHGRILSSAGFHPLSRFHLFSGIFTYLASAFWCVTLVAWGVQGREQGAMESKLGPLVLVLVLTNLMLPRIFGWLNDRRARANPESALSSLFWVLCETLVSAALAPSLMLHRLRIMGRVLMNAKARWLPHRQANLSILDYARFHWLETVLGLGLLALFERASISPWFLPLALCLAATPLFSWLVARPVGETGTSSISTGDNS